LINMADVKLYSFFRSTATWRVRIALNLKKVPHDMAMVWVREDAHEHPDYRAINPHGFVPAMQVGEQSFGQALAMLEYREEVYPDPPLLPKDPLARAQVRAAAALIACDLHPLNNRRVLHYLKDDLELTKAAVTAWEAKWVTAGYAGLEAQMAPLAGQYLYGDSISIADLCLVPQVENGNRAGVDLAEYPTLHRVYRRLIDLPEFKDAHPSNQKDNPEK